MSTQKLQIIGNFIKVDDTLTQAGIAADAKAIGDAINQLQADIDSKVTAAEGMGLSTNDYTNEDKEKLANAALISDVDAKYTKPETGIPESDFAMNVQESLALANTALQEHQDISGKLDITAKAADSDKLNGESAEYYLDYDNFTNTPTIPTIEDLATELEINKMQSDIDSKVDKADGMGLSTNDYTTAEKDKLATVEPDANFYEHPTHTSYSSGLYKVTVDDEGHVSSATLVEKEDIVDLGIPAQDTTYDTEISDLNEAIGNVDTGVKDNKVAIEEIQKDYLTSADKTQLQDSITEVSNKATANAAAITTLNGDGDGSVKQAIDNAFNEFAANMNDDKVVNTYKELIDYAAAHGSEFTELVGEVDTIDTRVGEVETDLSSYKTEVSEQFTEVDTTINNHVANTDNPHGVTKEQIGLGNVDNTSDVDKPISNATQTALDTMQEALNGKAAMEHVHEDLYYTKDEISEMITVDDIDAMCGATIYLVNEVTF